MARDSTLSATLQNSPPSRGEAGRGTEPKSGHLAHSGPMSRSLRVSGGGKGLKRGVKDAHASIYSSTFDKYFNDKHGLAPLSWIFDYGSDDVELVMKYANAGANGEHPWASSFVKTAWKKVREKSLSPRREAVMVVATVVQKALEKRRDSSELRRMLVRAAVLSRDLDKCEDPGLHAATHAEQPHQAITSREEVAPVPHQAAMASARPQVGVLHDGGADGGSKGGEVDGGDNAAELLMHLATANAGANEECAPMQVEPPHQASSGHRETASGANHIAMTDTCRHGDGLRDGGGDGGGEGGEVDEALPDQDDDMGCVLESNGDPDDSVDSVDCSEAPAATVARHSQWLDPPALEASDSDIKSYAIEPLTGALDELYDFAKQELIKRSQWLASADLVAPALLKMSVQTVLAMAEAYAVYDSAHLLAKNRYVYFKNTSRVRVVAAATSYSGALKESLKSASTDLTEGSGQALQAVLGLAIAGGQRCARLEITMKQCELMEIKDKVTTAVKPHILSISRELTTGGAELDAEAMKTRRGRAWLYYRHLLARDGEMSDQSSLARSVRIIDGTESVIDGQGTTNPGQQEEEQESNLRAPLRRPEFDPVLSPEEVAAWHARSFLNEPAKRAITVPPDHPDADSLARWLDVESININLEPTQPDLPSGIVTYQ